MNAVMRSQAILLFAHSGRMVLSLAIAILLARNLAPADFGFVALVSSICIVAMEMLDMGTTAVATREVAARPERERETLEGLLALRRLLAAAAFAAVIALACSDYVPVPEQRIALAMAAGAIFLLHLHAYALVFHLRQAYGRGAMLALGGQLAFLLACIVAVGLHAGGAVIAVLLVAREVIQVVGSRWMALRLLGYRLRFAWMHPGVASLLRAGWMIGLAGVGYKLTAYAGGFILWEIASPEALATFNAAQRLLAPASDMAWLFVTPLFAALGGAIARDRAAFRVQVDGYAKLLFAMSAGLAVAGYWLAPFVLRLLYGEVYASGPLSAVGAFRWLALAYLFALVSPVLIVGEMVQGNARALLAMVGAGLALNLAANAWAIPRHGAEGAAMVLFACEALVFAVLLVRYALRRDLRVGPDLALYLAPAAGLAALLWLLAVSPVLQLAAACLWAPVTLWALMKLPAQRACRASLAAIPRAGSI